MLHLTRVEVLDREVTDKEWDKNERENVADSDDTNILVKWGIIIKCQGGRKISKIQYNPLPQLSTKEKCKRGIWTRENL